MKPLLALCLLITSAVIHAQTPATTLAHYTQLAGGSASAARGEAFFRAQVTREGTQHSCASCHTDDPKATGRTRAHKPIEPLAPVANPTRLTDLAKTERWFSRNCRDVLARECTAQEKADFVAFLVGVK